MYDQDEVLACLPRLRRYARMLARNTADADDLVQDTLERAWNKSTLWQGVVDMRTWLMTIMHNLHVDSYRRGKLSTVELDSEVHEVPVRPGHEHTMTIRDLQSSLEYVPDDQREVLLLVAVEGMAYADIAKMLSIPIGTVMSRLSRGRERLRAVMEGRESPIRLKVVK